MISSGPILHTHPPGESGFPTTERVSPEHAFTPSLSLLLRSGWAGLHLELPHAMPITSAAGTVPAVGAASEHSAQDSQRGRGRKNEREEKTAQVKPQDKQSQDREGSGSNLTQTVWPSAGHGPEDATWCSGIMLNSTGVWHVPTENFPGSWKPF